MGQLSAPVVVDERPLSSAEAADRIAWHLSRQIERALLDVSDEDRVRVGRPGRPCAARSARRARCRRRPIRAAGRSGDGAPRDPRAGGPTARRRRIDEPLIPLLDTTLLTNAPGEPTLWNQLRSEIESADAIDVVMAFIRRSGIAPAARSPCAVTATTAGRCGS